MKGFLGFELQLILWSLIPRRMQHCTRVYCENLPLVSSYIIRFSQINQNGNVGKSTIFEFQFGKVFLCRYIWCFLNWKLYSIDQGGQWRIQDFPGGPTMGWSREGGEGAGHSYIVTVNCDRMSQFEIKKPADFTSAHTEKSKEVENHTI